MPSARAPSPEGEHILKTTFEVADLIRACAVSGDDLSWREFLRQFRRPIGLAVVRAAQRSGINRPQEFVDDLVQEIIMKLFADKCARLYEFSRAHPDAIDAYIKTIATNHAYDFFKAGRSQKRGGGETAQLLESIDVRAELSSAGGIDAIQREILLSEIYKCLETNVKGSSSSRDRTIFWLYYRQGMSANAIAAIPSLGLGVKGVESVLVRVTRLLREKIVVGYRPVAKNSPPDKGFGSLESY